MSGVTLLGAVAARMAVLEVACNRCDRRGEPAGAPVPGVPGVEETPEPMTQATKLNGEEGLMRKTPTSRGGWLLAVASIVATHVASAAIVPAQGKDPPTQSRPVKAAHRVVVQVSEDDPKLMNVALNNAENLTQYFKDRNETVQIEFVAYGPGLAMMRSDTSPVKQRLETFAATLKNVTFDGCGNTLATQSAKENKELSLVPEAHKVSSGIARIVELQEQGWSYVRP